MAERAALATSEYLLHPCRIFLATDKILLRVNCLPQRDSAKLQIGEKLAGESVDFGWGEIIFRPCGCGRGSRQAQVDLNIRILGRHLGPLLKTDIIGSNSFSIADSRSCRTLGCVVKLNKNEVEPGVLDRWR